jgi:hypothetical protein
MLRSRIGAHAEADSSATSVGDPSVIDLTTDGWSCGSRPLEQRADCASALLMPRSSQLPSSRRSRPSQTLNHRGHRVMRRLHVEALTLVP